MIVNSKPWDKYWNTGEKNTMNEYLSKIPESTNEDLKTICEHLEVEDRLYEIVNKAVRSGISPKEFRKLCSDMWFQASADYIKESWN